MQEQKQPVVLRFIESKIFIFFVNTLEVVHDAEVKKKEEDFKETRASNMSKKFMRIGK